MLLARLSRQGPVQRRGELLSFVITGGGPTGVEVAAELHDMVLDDMRKVCSSPLWSGLLHLCPGAAWVRGALQRGQLKVVQSCATDFCRSMAEPDAGQHSCAGLQAARHL